MRKFVFGLLMLGMAMPAAAANMVTNGDFSAGNAGFTSGYNYIAPAGPFSLYPEGAYTVDTNAANVHNQWASITGVGGSGNYLIVNGSTSGSIDVWKSGSITVTPNTNYFFEAYATNTCCYNRTGASSQLTFSIAGNATSATLATFDTANAAVGSWQLLSNVWNSGTNTSVLLTLSNASTVADGNDFGVDKINFGTSSVAVPEPGTWAMLIAGFGMVGFAARRRKAAVAA